MRKLLLGLGVIGTLAAASTTVISCKTSDKLSSENDLLKKQNHKEVIQEMTSGVSNIAHYNMVDFKNIDSVLTAADHILVNAAKYHKKQLVILASSACPFCRRLFAGEKYFHDFDSYKGMEEGSVLHKNLVNKYKDYTVWILEDQAPSDEALPWRASERKDRPAQIWNYFANAVHKKYTLDSGLEEKHGTPKVFKILESGKITRVLHLK